MKGRHYIVKDTAIGLFEVYELSSKECYIVYGVKPVLSPHTGDIFGTEFLFYKMGRWVWENADKYEPKL